MMGETFNKPFKWVSLCKQISFIQIRAVWWPIDNNEAILGHINTHRFKVFATREEPRKEGRGKTLQRKMCNISGV